MASISHVGLDLSSSILPIQLLCPQGWPRTSTHPCTDASSRHQEDEGQPPCRPYHLAHLASLAGGRFEPLLGLMIECAIHQQLGPATLCDRTSANTNSSTKHANARLCATFLKHSTVQYVEMTLLPHTTAQGMPLKRHKIAMTPLSTADAWLLLFLTRGHSWQLLPPAVARRVVCGRRVVSVPIPKHVVLRVAAFRQHALHSCARVAFHL